ncbi:NHLP bacteriocin system secretion protein [Xinfangfangia sp. D13-10-4-6]|uniref:NHLP bacteriocin system secretion protein n=1 Tax=Pseudogemmobacter hezensis TaxID=2737662 RepID=UPI001551836E|nr:NHLP bacteriocin system secretion protein [Pseudogemmobacter hezensis]NPD14918.1 NHLP bacteriocin system secretion protein [Pseudogemmobacter hezensis]
MTSGDLFREKARRAAAGRQGQDAALQVMQPRLWLAGLGLAGLCVAALAFTFAFRLPVTVAGKGIVLSAGGVMDVAATASGQLTGISLHPGQMIESGQVIALVNQPELELEVMAARASYEDAKRSHDQLARFQSREAAALDATLTQRLQSLEARGLTLDARRDSLAERLANLGQLMERGNIAREQFLLAESDLMSVESALADASDSRAQLEADRTTRRIDAEAELLRSELARDEAARRLAALESQHARLGAILSPFSGRVLEIKANIGQIVQNGTPILALEREPDTAPIVVAYVPGFEAKRLSDGMPVEISPASAAREEQGFLRGRVTRVSETPASSAGMMRRLQNDRLLESFMQQIDTPFEVEIALMTDAAGQPLWSRPMRDGQAQAIENGTLADVTFTLSELPLAALAVQALRGLETDFTAVQAEGAP